MSAESLSSYSEMLKILFEEEVVESLAENIFIYRFLKNRGQIRPYGGREIRFTVRTQRQEGTGFVPNTADSLPTATTTDAIEPSFNVHNFYGVGEIDDFVLEDSRADKYAYREGLDDIRESLLTSMSQDIAAVLYGDGRAVMGELPAADDQTTITTNHPNYLREGKLVDLIDATDNYTTLAADRTITDVEYLMNSCVVQISGSAPSGSATGDFFTIANSIGAAGQQYAWFGLQAAVNNANPPLANYGGLDRTSVSKRWSSQVDDNGGTNRQITERLVMNNLGLARRWSKMKVKDLVMLFPWDVGSEYWEELVSDRVVQVMGNEAMKLVGGYDGATNETGEAIGKFAGQIPMYADEMAPANILWLLNLSPFRLYQTHDPELVRKDGQTLVRRIDRPAYQFRYLYRANLVVRDPRCQIRINDVAHS